MKLLMMSYEFPPLGGGGAKVVSVIGVLGKVLPFI